MAPQDTAIERHYDAIMNTPIDLYELAGDEHNSVESNLDVMIQLCDGLGKQKDHAKGRLTERQRIIDGLIQQTGGRTSLKNLESYLRELADPENDERTGVLNTIVSDGVKNFVYDISNEEVVKEISHDDALVTDAERYGEDTEGQVTNYIADYLEKKFGILSS